MYQFEEYRGRLFIQAAIEGEGPPPSKRSRYEDVSSEEESDLSLTESEVWGHYDRGHYDSNEEIRNGNFVTFQKAVSE